MDSIVVVPLAPSGRLRNAHTAPAVSARVISAPPCMTPPAVDSRAPRAGPGPRPRARWRWPRCRVSRERDEVVQLSCVDCGGRGHALSIPPSGRATIPSPVSPPLRQPRGLAAVSPVGGWVSSAGSARRGDRPICGRPPSRRRRSRPRPVLRVGLHGGELPWPRSPEPGSPNVRRAVIWVTRGRPGGIHCTSPPSRYTTPARSRHGESVRTFWFQPKGMDDPVYVYHFLLDVRSREPEQRHDAVHVNEEKRFYAHSWISRSIAERAHIRCPSVPCRQAGPVEECASGADLLGRSRCRHRGHRIGLRCSMTL